MITDYTCGENGGIRIVQYEDSDAQGNGEFKQMLVSGYSYRSDLVIHTLLYEKMHGFDEFNWGLWERVRDTRSYQKKFAIPSEEDLLRKVKEADGSLYLPSVSNHRSELDFVPIKTLHDETVRPFVTDDEKLVYYSSGGKKFLEFDRSSVEKMQEKMITQMVENQSPDMPGIILHHFPFASYST